MNKEEYSSRDNRNLYYHRVQKYLRDWKIENNINESCVVHHIDNEPDAIKYNEEHYELWGHEIDDDGNAKFELGKYVTFMTRASHTRYHCKSKHLSEEHKNNIRNAHIGKTFSDEHKKNLSISKSGHRHYLYGKHVPEDIKEKMRVSIKCAKEKVTMLYKYYKQSGGILSWNDFQRSLKNNEINIK